MSHPTEEPDERPDPLRDQHVAFPGAPAPRPTGPPLPDSAWAPAARTSLPGPPPSGPSRPSPAPEPAPPGWAPGRRGPTPPRRRRVLGAIVVVWICFGVFGNHDYQSSGSSGTGTEMGSGGYGPDAPADGHDPSALLPVGTDVGTVPSGVRQFRIEVASTGDRMIVNQATQRGSGKAGALSSWSGDIEAGAGYAAPVGTVGEQSSKGPDTPKVSGIVTATAADSTSTLQCRVYANDVLVLISTGPGTVTCRVPAVDGASG
ncbi:MAG: hypothetical protein ABI112_09315 [Terracoccus sp.]